ncbi:MAG TPA: DoxX family protein [Burkholderiaceae bacterium]|nr:DoxX family protein [Burkholderiaceae bacterium]
MSSSTLDDFGKLVLRVAVGGMLIMHGIGKLIGGIGGIENMVIGAGMPAFFAWAVYIGEVIAPALMILGYYARLGGIIGALNMLVAIALAHSNQIFSVGSMGGWAIELQGLFLFGCVSVALLGAGRYSVAGKHGSWN